MPDDNRPSSPETADLLDPAERARQLAERSRAKQERHRARMEARRHNREQARIAAEAARAAGETDRTAAEAARREVMGEVQAATEVIQETLQRMEKVEDLRRAVRRGDEGPLKH